MLSRSLSIAGGVALYFFSVVFSGAAIAAPQDFILDPAHTFATFEVRHLGISTQRGRFNRTTGTATFDFAEQTGNLVIIIDARSVDSGDETLEKFLRGEDFFHVEKFPEITFRSSSISFNDDKPERIEGELTLLGVTRPVSLAISGYACTRLPFLVRVTCGIDATTTIRRSEFGMTRVLTFVSDEVKLLIQAEAVRQEPPPPAVE